MKTESDKDHMNDDPSKNLKTGSSEHELDTGHFFRIPSVPLPGKTVWKIATI